jgi:hypothetical protein
VQILSTDNLRSQIEKLINSWKDTFYLNFDDMLLIAIHYKWNEDKMNIWFEEKTQLEY